ncbi:sulfotransferase [Candidatus Hydrogenedentota bacterium]
MKLAKRIIRKSSTLAGRAFSIFPFQGISRPIFIIGCGRSGTTILGTTLSKHRKITYLNEPRHLWFPCFPKTDIWSEKAARRHGKIVLTDADADPRQGERLRRIFKFETIRTGRPVLVEKLPVNGFRLRFICKIFPDARFIHIYRNGLEVARSIDKFALVVPWFGFSSYKWNQLAQHASTDEETAFLPKLCTNNYERGLLEWRLNTEAVVEFLRDLLEDSFHEISYMDLVDDPVRTMNRVMSFLDIEKDSNVTDFAGNYIARKTKQLESSAISEKEKLIGGKLLPLSRETPGGLTKRST